MPEKTENMTISAAAREPCPPPAGIPLHRQHLLGHVDIRIAADGTWLYMGTPIRRKRMVTLFSSVLRRDTDGHYWLITPAEAARITVDDAPLLAVEMQTVERDGRPVLRFRTNVGTWVEADAAHPIRIAIDPESGAPRPYLQIADDGSEARIVRSVFYTLVENAVEADIKGTACLVVESGGARFTLGPVTED